MENPWKYGSVCDGIVWCGYRSKENMELMTRLYGNMESGRGFNSRSEDTFYFHNLLTLDGSKMIMRRVWVLASSKQLCLILAGCFAWASWRRWRGWRRELRHGMSYKSFLNVLIIFMTVIKAASFIFHHRWGWLVSSANVTVITVQDKTALCTIMIPSRVGKRGSPWSPAKEASQAKPTSPVCINKPLMCL